jgi:hypothetical protein
MPHVVYLGEFILCPWPDCGFRIELVDFQLEFAQDPGLYARVIAAWGNQPDFGLVGRCPGCKQHVWFGLAEKRTAADPAAPGVILLPDDWHLHAYVA